MKDSEIIVSEFKKRHIIVIGDIMLDTFIIGEVSRISPEAPVPVVLKKEEKALLGGAANVAQNIASLGGKVSLFGLVGDDMAGSSIKELLHNTPLIHDELIVNKNYVTTEKIRIVSHGQHMLRVDTEKLHVMQKIDEEVLINRYKEIVNSADIVILSDYNKGVFSEEFTKKLITIANKKNIHVIADTKPSHCHFFKNAFCIKPNKKEALLMSKNIEIPLVAKDIAKNLHTNVVITLGEEGMYIFENGSGKKIKTKAKTIYDVVGAGDTVIATLALVLADKKATLIDAAEIANHAASIVVGKHGTSTVTQDELLYSLNHNTN